MGFIADADDVGTVGEQIDVLGKLLYGGEKHAPTGAPLQFVFQVLATFHLLYHAVADKLFGVEQQTRKLIVQVSAVGDEDDGGAAQGFALHQQAREEEHGERLATTRGAEIGAALAVATRIELAVVEDILIERTGSEILRITADELPLVL